jgi:hypothetical protein
MYSVPPAKCSYHSSRPAAAHCTICGRSVCRSCAQPNKNAKPVCRPCALQTGVRQRRSAGVTILAILSIIGGALGLMCFPFAVLLSAIALPRTGEAAAIPGYATYGTASVVIMFAVCPFLLVFGIGLLRLRDWARKWMVFTQWFIVLWVAAEIALQFIWLVPAMNAAGIRIDWLNYIISWAVTVALCALYIIFFTRPMVKVQFGHQVQNWTPASAVVPPGQHR